MPKPRDLIPRTLSARIILQTVSSITLLLIPTILAMVIGTRLVIREEVGREVDHALDGIAYRIDNTLLGIEQTSAIIQQDVPRYLDQPQELYKLCRKVLEADSSINGCAIALNPDHYLPHGKPFMAYLHRTGEAVIASETFTSLPFTEQEWYVKPLLEGSASWVGPLKNKDTETEPLISYVVPIVKDSSAVAVLGIDISLDVFTRIAQNYRTSSHSYITLLDRVGSYIVHPDSTRLMHMDSLAELKDAEDPSVMEALQAMVRGQSGRREFILDGTRYLLAFMPFRPSAYPGRVIGSLGWSIAVIYPEEELFEEFDPGFRLAVLMTIVGILLLFAGAYTIPHVSLKPLRDLVKLTNIISKSNYKLPGFETSRTDEVGRLQTQYNKMLNAVAGHVEQLQNLSEKEASLQTVLARTYARTKKVQKHQEAFFENMTHQMADVTAEIQDNVDKLCEFRAGMGEEEIKGLIGSIEEDGVRVTEILNDMLKSNS